MFVAIRFALHTSTLNIIKPMKTTLRIFALTVSSNTKNSSSASIASKSTFKPLMMAKNGSCVMSVRDGCTPNVLIFQFFVPTPALHACAAGKSMFTLQTTKMPLPLAAIISLELTWAQKYLSEEKHNNVC